MYMSISWSITQKDFLSWAESIVYGMEVNEKVKKSFSHMYGFHQNDVARNNGQPMASPWLLQSRDCCTASSQTW